MTQEATPLLVITGPVGIGKTSVSFAISKLLNKRGIPHAVIDLDQLRYAYPVHKNDRYNERLGQKNLASVWHNFKEFGAKCLIVPTVIDKGETIEDFRRSVPNSEIFIVRLHAPIQTVHSRLRNRESDELEWYLNRAEKLIEVFEQNKFEHAVVDTENKIIKEIAKEVVELWSPLRTSFKQ